MTEEEQLYVQQTLSLPDTIELFEVTLDNVVHRFTNAFRTDAVCWKEQEYAYLPLHIEQYRYSEDNASVVPSLSFMNFAALYSDFLSSKPDLTTARLKFYIVYESEIFDTVLEATSSLYAFKASFVLSKQLSGSYEQLTYQLDPIGFLFNTFAPVRLILRDGLFNMNFPGVQAKHA